VTRVRTKEPEGANRTGGNQKEPVETKRRKRTFSNTFLFPSNHILQEKINDIATQFNLY